MGRNQRGGLTDLSRVEVRHQGASVVTRMVSMERIPGRLCAPSLHILIESSPQPPGPGPHGIGDIEVSQGILSAAGDTRALEVEIPQAHHGIEIPELLGSSLIKCRCPVDIFLRT